MLYGRGALVPKGKVPGLREIERFCVEFVMDRRRALSAESGGGTNLANQKRAVTAPELPAPVAPLSHGIEAGPFIFVSGQVPRDSATGSVPEGIDAQARVVLQNVERVLRAAGCSLADVVKVTAHLADLADRDAFNAVYRELMPEPHPARTMVGSQLGAILVEVDVIAFRP